MEIIFRTKGKVDYDKIREITQEVVKEEMKNQQSNQPTPLTKEDIQEAVCNAIIHADTKREDIAREKIKNTKLSIWSIIFIAFFGVLAAFFVVLAITFFAEQGQELSFRISNGAKMIAFSTIYFFVAMAEYATSKNKDRNLGFNFIALLIALASLVVTII